MSSLGRVDIPSAKRARLTTDFNLCIICQQTSGEKLIVKPTVYKQVLETIGERAHLGDKPYLECEWRLYEESAETLIQQTVTWHSSYYQDNKKHPITDHDVPWELGASLGDFIIGRL